jgi:hypothetical protein
MSDHNVGRYRAMADECCACAEQARYDLDRLAWLKLAGDWTTLADDAALRSRDGYVPGSAAFGELAPFIADYAHWPRSAGGARAGDPLEEHIARRAYELWQQAGFPSGRDEEFAHQAERNCAT